MAETESRAALMKETLQEKVGEGHIYTLQLLSSLSSLSLFHKTVRQIFIVTLKINIEGILNQADHPLHTYFVFCQ